MIRHELFGQHLRLGNFLFKYAWSIAKMHQFNEFTTYPEYYLWKYLQTSPKISDNELYWSDSQIKVNWEWSPEEVNRVDTLIQNPGTKTITLDSFFQSEKWFENYEQQVFESLQIKPDFKEKIYIDNLQLFQKPVIGIGVRLGDFVGHGDFYQIKPNWYLQALEHYFPTWREDFNVIVFSDHIERAKQLYNEHKELFFAEPNGTHTHADNFKHYHNDASKQFVLGTMMDHWIIGNSTFSWWQAWLATYGKKDSKVIHSGKVFSDSGNMRHINTEHYYAKEWTCF